MWKGNPQLLVFKSCFHKNWGQWKGRMNDPTHWNPVADNTSGSNGISRGGVVLHRTVLSLPASLESSGQAPQRGKKDDFSLTSWSVAISFSIFLCVCTATQHVHSQTVFTLWDETGMCKKQNEKSSVFSVGPPSFPVEMQICWAFILSITDTTV